MTPVRAAQLWSCYSKHAGVLLRVPRPTSPQAGFCPQPYTDGTTGRKQDCRAAVLANQYTVLSAEICSDDLDNDGDGLTDKDDPDCWRCGDSITDPGEQCDDGNNFNGDGCDSTCKVVDFLPPSPFPPPPPPTNSFDNNQYYCNANMYCSVCNGGYKCDSVDDW